MLEPPAAAKSAPHVFGLSCMPADLPELERIFNRICAAHPTVVGKKASAKDREGMVGPQSCLTYGEIMFHPFAVAMLKVSRRRAAQADPPCLAYLQNVISAGPR